MAASSIRPIRNCLNVAILDIQGDTSISLCLERTLARWRALAFRRGAFGRAARFHIVKRTSGLYLINTQRDMEYQFAQLNRCSM